MSRLAQGDFETLALDLTALPKKESFEYAINGPFITASVVLGFRKDGAGFNAEGKVRAKIPFKGLYTFDCAAKGDDLQGPAAFNSYSEAEAKKPERLWSADAKQLKLRVDSIQSRTFEFSESGAPAHSLLNPLLILTVLGAKGQLNGRSLVGQFVASSKIFGIRIDFATAGAEFRVYSEQLVSPVMTENAWTNVDWPESEVLTGSWNPEQDVISQFNVRVPILGALKIPLVGHSRE